MALIVSLISVIASVSFTAKTGVNITYTASEITGSITASYQLKGADTPTLIKTVTLDGSEVDDGEGDMGSVTQELGKTTNYIDFIFEISNTTNFKVYANLAIPTTTTNAVVTYGTDGSTFGTDNDEIEIAAGTSAVPTTVTYYVRVAIDNLGQDFALSGNFALNLSKTSSTT